ncbi:LysR substrate-binding domain-containing protein [Caballeronia sp. GAWG1-5s-s]|uniref:LysR substrate-binding domain-containing protein n=1 Tax=Caballeronia sp. GAWG1-5s-s TaxID=2921743 RepID=UPI00202984B2
MPFDAEFVQYKSFHRWTFLSGTRTIAPATAFAKRLIPIPCMSEANAKIQPFFSAHIAMTTPRLDLDSLRTFLAIADGGSFTAAAASVGRTQSAISLKIRKLEEALDKQLFERNAHRTTLTPAGELLLGYARRLVRDSDAALAHLRASEATGTIRLGIGELFVPDHLPRVLTRFRQAHPKVRLEVQVGLSADLLEHMRSGALEVVVANREGDERGGRVVWTEPLRWVAADDFELGNSGPVPLVALPPQCAYRRMAIDALASVGRPADVVYACTSLLGVEAAIAAGSGLAILGQSSLARNPGLRDLSPHLPPLPACEIAVYGEAANNGRALRALIQFIEDSLRSESVLRKT